MTLSVPITLRMIQDNIKLAQRDAVDTVVEAIDTIVERLQWSVLY